MNTSKLILVAALVAAPTSVFAQTIQQVRCTADSLSIGQATARLEWARKCGLTLNTGAAPKTGNPANFFQSLKAADANTFAGANEYAENNTAQAFSNTVNDYNVNYSQAWSLFGSFFAYTVSQDASGPTLNFYRWSHPTTRPQPLYPSFDSTVSGTGTQLFPPASADGRTGLAVNPNAPCTMFTDPGGTTTPWAGTTAFFVAFYCTSSCYRPDQSVRFSTGDMNILDAFNAVRNDVVTLAPNATMENPSTQVSPVYSYTHESRNNVTQPIYTVTTASGGSLSVTHQHPVLVVRHGSGRLVMAEKLKKGDELLKADGTPDAVTRIEKAEHTGQVYNLAPTATELVSNILIAQGFMVGSSRFQNDDLKYMNRALLFRAVPDDIMPR